MGWGRFKRKSGSILLDNPQQGNLNPADYKKAKEREKKELNDKINKLAAEYNRLVELYNKLLAEAVMLKERNIQKARAILEEMERSR